MIDESTVFGHQTVRLAWPTGRAWEKFKADFSAAVRANE